MNFQKVLGFAIWGDILFIQEILMVTVYADMNSEGFRVKINV